MFRMQRVKSENPRACAPAMARLQDAPPSPLPGAVLWSAIALFLAVTIWATVGRLDIVAVAQGRLVPQSQVSPVQPAEGGLVREVLVREGDSVLVGQVLMRLDASISDADRTTLLSDLRLRLLTLRRIDAELAGREMEPRPDDDAELYRRVEAQFLARRSAHRDVVESERALLERTRHELRQASELEAKLSATAPILREQERAWNQLAQEGFAGRLMALDRQRSRIENEQDLKAQQHSVSALRAAVEQSERRLAHLGSTYRQALHSEQIENAAQRDRLEQELAKQGHRQRLLELTAPVSGVVKDLAIRTPGPVVSAGAVLATVVPTRDALVAEVWVANADAGLVRPGHRVQLKLAAFPFQHFGLLEGRIRHLGADASERSDGNGRLAPVGAGYSYKALVELATSSLERDGMRFDLTAGMLVTGEIHLGTRSVLEYLVSPLRRVMHESARER